jgi:Lon protease-like protein
MSKNSQEGKEHGGWATTLSLSNKNTAEESYFEEVAPAEDLKLLSGIPLFSLSDRTAVADDDTSTILVWPIPMGHVPEALRTCSIYQADAAELTPIQKCMVSHHESHLCGFLYNETYGCIAAITTSSTNHDEQGAQAEEGAELLYRGECWFRVVEYEAKVPFPIATVELLVEGSSSSSLSVLIDETETDYDAVLVQKLKGLLMDYSQLQIEIAQEPKSPLEVSLLEVLAAIPHQAELLAAQERRTVIEAAPMKYLVDLAPDLAGFTNEQRRALMLQDSLAAKAQHACEIVYERLAMVRARKMAAAITDSVDASAKDLKVGMPTLPLWAKQIKSGMRVEYFWNVETGWCSGTVKGDPMFIVDEWIMSVKFDDDGSTHRLSLSADDKIRWRPL